MTQVANIGKQKFAWGLSWASVDEKSPAKAAKKILDPAQAWLYTSVPSDDGRLAIGFTDKLDEIGRGKVYSYAAALAKIAEEGIYVAPIGDDHLWYVVIAHGSVVPETDAIEPADEALGKIMGLREAFGLPVRVAEGFAVSIPTDGEFDSQSVLAAHPIKPLTRMGGASKLKTAVVLALLAGFVGGAGWWMLGPEDEPIFVDNSAQLEREARARYLSAIQGELHAIPRDAGWVSRAARLAQAGLPEVWGGWVLHEVACVPGGCSGSYRPNDDGGPFSLSVFESRFKDGQVVRGDVAGQVTVNVPLDVAMGLQWTDDMIEGGYAHGEHLTDVIGGLSMRMPGMELDGQVIQSDLKALHAGPPAAANLSKEQFVVGARERVDPSRVNYTAAALARSGFAPVALNFNTGLGAAAPVWSITAVRITGDH